MHTDRPRIVVSRQRAVEIRRIANSYVERAVTEFSRRVSQVKLLYVYGRALSVHAYAASFKLAKLGLYFNGRNMCARPRVYQNRQYSRPRADVHHPVSCARPYIRSKQDAVRSETKAPAALYQAHSLILQVIDAFVGARRL